MRRRRHDIDRGTTVLPERQLHRPILLLVFVSGSERRRSDDWYCSDDNCGGDGGGGKGFLRVAAVPMGIVTGNNAARVGREFRYRAGRPEITVSSRFLFGVS
mmetsp:Transcript_53988/g.65176  ORF Transcript_53988/g.65176 Transcript_53988/m.65176 type:complete len:102 (+) Transcript_53988:1221-1526(+)